MYHEFGHALDHQLDLCHNKDILDLIKRYETTMQKIAVRAVHDMLKNKMVVQSVSGYGYADIMFPYYRDCIRFGKASDAVLKRLGISRQRIAAGQCGALMDTIAAMSKGTHGAGHAKSYWKQNADNPAKEFIAHCFENRYACNEMFRWLYKQLYDDMIAVLKKALGK